MFQVFIKNPSNYETIKVYIVVPGDPYDASILGVFRDKRKAELYAEIHNCVVEEFETSDDEEIVFGWKFPSFTQTELEKCR